MSNKAISINDLPVLANGSVLTFQDEPVEIVFNDIGEDDLKLVFIFKTDTSNPNTSVRGAPDDLGRMTITAINVPPGIGGPTEPMKLGTKDGKNLYMLLVSNVVGKMRSIQYTIYRDK
jgi:hypothetical protein